MKYILIVCLLFLSLPVAGQIVFSRESVLSPQRRQTKQRINQNRFKKFDFSSNDFNRSVFSFSSKPFIEVLLAGDLDINFGVGGKIITQVGAADSEAFAVANQPDGKFVLAGYASGSSDIDFALARFNENGSLDTTFGSAGKVITNIGSGDNTASALAIQPFDGKLIAAGNSFNGRNNDFALARYKTDGTLDETFGAGGIATTDFNNSFDYINAVVVQPDGKIVAAGYVFNNSYFQFALARYNSDGTLDNTFGSGGQTTTRFTNLDDAAWAIALQTDGKIVVAGEADTDFAIARYNSDGSLDSTFDADGKARTSIAKFDSAYGIAVQTDGKVVAAGETGSGFNSDFALIRYNSDGSLDTNFGAGGKVTTPIGSGNEIASSLAMQATGQILVGGFSYNGANDDFVLIRYNANGALDSSFGANGKAVTNFSGNSSDNISALAIQGNRAIAAGSSNANFAAAAYLLSATSCSYSLSAASADFPLSGGTGEFTVTTNADCSRTVVSNASFITITSGSGGSGSGVVAFTVAANSGLARSGTISVGGQTFTINQTGGKSRKRVRFF